VGKFVNEQVNTVNFLFCHEDDAYGAKTGMRVSGTFNYLAEQLLAARQAFPSRSYPNLGLLPALRRESTAPSEGGIPEGLAVGSPDRIINVIKKWEAVGVDRINFLLNAMETVPQEQVLASLRLFAREVMPKFAEPVGKAGAGVAAGGR
jgi:alkanesulfonate monooxygenase SsuD/methylene tetrahydromethanopterin reductase-like flavin-dependent oxidoreductase (luciferase family)